MNDLHQAYLFDLVYRLRERTAEAASDHESSGTPFTNGAEAAFREVLSIMQNQAETFGIPLAEICLDGFQPLSGDVRPPRV